MGPSTIYDDEGHSVSFGSLKNFMLPPVAAVLQPEWHGKCPSMGWARTQAPFALCYHVSFDSSKESQKPQEVRDRAPRMHADVASVVAGDYLGSHPARTLWGMAKRREPGGDNTA